MRKRKSIAGKKDVKRAIVMFAIVIAALALFSIMPMPVSADAPGNPGAGCHSETKYYGTINGGMYFEQYGFLQFRSMTKTFDNVPDGIKFARVYTGVWAGSPGKGGKFNITIANATSSYTTTTYQACDPCPGEPCADYQSLRCDTLNWSGNVPPNVPSGDIHDYVTGCNVHFISYNATPYITPGSNTITVNTSCSDNCTCWDGRIYLAALLVVYEDASMPEITYWINEGAPFMEDNSTCDGPDDHLNISFYFNGTHISNPAKVKYWTLGFPHVANATTEPAYMKLNGNSIGEYDYMEKYGGYEVFYRWDDIPPGYLNPSSNLFCYSNPNPFYERVNVAALILEGESPTPTPTPAPAPITEQWNMTFGGAGDDYGYSVQQTADGGYILAGDTRSYGAGDADVWLIKTDSKGNEQWSRTFGGAEADLLDRGSVRQTSDGGYVITSYTYSYGADNGSVWLLKTNQNGNEEWNRTFGGEGLDWGHSVRQTSDGGYVIAGRIIPPYAGDRADAWLIRTDSNGVEQWNRTFGADGCEYAASVQQTADDGYVMTGRTTSFGAAEADAWLIRTDSNGIEQWNRTFGGAGYDYGYSVQQTSDGGYVIAGSTNGRQDVWLIKTRPDGTEEWNTIFGGPAKADEGYSVQQTSDGGYILAGYTESYGTANSADVWLIRTDSNGIEQWNMTVGGTGLEKGYSVHQTADGDYIAAGYTNSFGAGGYDLWLIKLSTPVVRQIDLLTTALETPSTLYANLTNTISATIKNNGTGDASSFNVSLSADGSPVDEVVVSGLGAGKSTAVSFSWSPSRTGDFELCVAADCDFEVNESNEGNNVLCKNVTVLPFEIDLLPTALETQSTPYANFTNTIRTTIKNNGTGNASSFNVSLTAGDVVVDKTGVSGLSVGESVVVNLYWTPSYTGDFELCVAADCDSNINESEEDNNVLCENVTVLSFEHPCWNDTFDDETKIAEMQKVVVSEGDVKIDLENVSWIWESNPLLVAGLGTANNPNPAIAFNITGDEKWNLIVGENYKYSGFYWDGTQWIKSSSLVSGLAWHAGPSGSISPTIAFNITGDGRWNLLAGKYYYPMVYGYYWNGMQWIENSSLVAGLGGGGGSPELAFNITGDRRWNLINRARGYYWNDNQWVENPSLVAGLGGEVPAIAFNITGDGRWNLIAGHSSGEFLGFYWNGTQWISDPSLVSGLGNIYLPQSVIAFNITGEGRWNLIAGELGGDNRRFYGYQWIVEKGSMKSVVIHSVSYFKNWTVFNANATVPAGTGITYKILDEKNDTIMTVTDGHDISGITQTSIRLFAELTTVNPSYTPVLHDWSVSWETGEVDLLPTAIETPANLYPNETWKISAAVKNDGGAHSGGFKAALYANDTEVDTEFIDDIPAGESTSVTFEWTPNHVGNYNLTVIADSDAAITESNETNNELTKEVSVLHSTVRRLTFDTNSSINPAIATDSEGNLHLVWSDPRDRNGEGCKWHNGHTEWIIFYDLYYKKLAPNGMVLVDDIKLTELAGTPLSAVNPAIAVDSNDNVHVVWDNETWTGIGVLGCTHSTSPYYMKLDNDGNIVVEPKLIIQLPEYQSVPARGIAVDHDGNFHIVVVKSRVEYADVKYKKLDKEGNELLNYTVDCQPGSDKNWAYMDVLDIALDSDSNAHIVYTKGPCGCYGMGCENYPCRGVLNCQDAWYAKIDDEGVHLQDLNGDLPLPSLYPSVCVDSGDNKHVIWSQHNGSGSGDLLEGGGFDFYYSKFDKSGNKVIDGKRLTYEDYLPEGYADEGGYYLPGVAHPIVDTESGVMHVTWSRESEKEIYYMAFDTSGDEITNKTLISFEDGDSWEPGIDACSDGAHLVWTDNRDGNNEIYYARMFLPENRVFILCPSDKWTPPNVNATYAIGIMHTMPGSETFDLTLANLDGADVAELNKSAITLNPNDIGEVILNVTDAVLGDYRVKVNVESQSNPGINTSAIITTSVITPKHDLVITAMDAYHNNTAESPWFNLSNEVDVEVKNVGTADAGAFNVSLYADGEYVDKKRISDLGTGSSTILQFKWTPVGADCFKDCSFTDTSREYNLTVAADCDNEVNESDETNNNLTEVEKACYNGYMADEPLENVAHGLLHGGLLFTTGDGTYGGLYSPGDSIDTTYEITLPAGASVVLARLNVYYTWHYEKDSCPAMEVSIDGTIVPLDVSYNDIKCYGAAWVFPWGNYVYNLTDYIQGNGTYTVTVKRTGGPSFCIAAPGIEVLYEDETRPLIEYWINEGADVLIGGRRGDGGHLSLEECINNATFPGNVDAGKVENATLGVVSPWAGAAWTPGMTNYLFFNDFELGQGVYHDETYEEAIGGISMHIGSTGAQVGVNLSDVTDYLLASDNRVGQGDDGDNMMPCNAFLVVEYGEEPPPTAFMIYGWVNDSTGAPVLNPNVTITNLNTAEVFIAETNASSSYYQVLTTSENVNAGNVLRFYASDNGNKTEFNHMVMQEEMDTGGFEQNITVVGVPAGICGDVDGKGGVTMFDGRQIWMNIIYGAGDYPIANEWVADVDGKGGITMFDGRQIWMNIIYGAEDYPLTCKPF